MLSASAVLCNFLGMPKDFPASVRLGMGKEEKGAGGGLRGGLRGGSSEGRKTQVLSIYHCIGCLWHEVIAIKIQAGCVG